MVAVESTVGARPLGQLGGPAAPARRRRARPHRPSSRLPRRHGRWRAPRRSAPPARHRRWSGIAGQEPVLGAVASRWLHRALSTAARGQSLRGLNERPQTSAARLPGFRSPPLTRGSQSVRTSSSRSGRVGRLGARRRAWVAAELRPPLRQAVDQAEQVLDRYPLGPRPPLAAVRRSRPRSESARPQRHAEVVGDPRAREATGSLIWAW